SVSRRAGVELGPNGEPLAYYIRSAHPGDIGVIGAFPWVWEAAPRKYGNGRWCVVHAFEPRAAGQVRGEPPLAPVLRKLHMLGKYDQAELQAAVLNAVMAAVVTSPNDHDQIAEAMSGGDNAALTNLQDARAGYYKSHGVKLEGAKVLFAFPEDKFDFSRPEHPNANYGGFLRTGLLNIAAAAGLSYEQLTGDWSQSNYSSARAADLIIRRGFSSRKDNFAAQHMQPHYRNWLEEAIARGRVKLPKGAPKFREAVQAYCAAKWIGPPRGFVDPEKEAKAAIDRLSVGISTYEREAAEQGEDYIDLLDQRARERREMLERGLDPDLLIRARLSIGTQPGPDNPPEPANPKPAADPSDEEGDAEDE
ncbi:MAG: phage portal protein, partial [Bradyrhizobium sp.]|nr:phage portal protein [Bradyrhizobium sp.]